MVAQLSLVHYCLAIEVQPIPRHHLFLLAPWVTGPGKGQCECSDQCKCDLKEECCAPAYS